ncbi:MAG: (Fe-S)-binding protein [Chitinophagaceae bacterium]|jgi:L-lactate dehydrogenase complex protein LldE|nr:(Fe-S)-binding protein [Chitinophagaceae bacterium]
MNVQIFVPCFVNQLYPDTAMNMVKVLRKAGCSVSYNPAQTCCGQPAFNAGFWADAKEVCSKFVADFEGADYIVAPSASCAGFVKNYYTKLFENSANWAKVQQVQSRIYEFSQFMVNVLKVEDVGATFENTITYHDSCAGLRECGIKTEPRKLLSNVRGLIIKEMNDVETCCGFGGTFAVKFQAISSAMADQKVDNAVATGADCIVSTDVSCLMHIEGYAQKAGKPMRCLHIADVLASGW